MENYNPPRAGTRERDQLSRWGYSPGPLARAAAYVGSAFVAAWAIDKATSNEEGESEKSEKGEKSKDDLGARSDAGKEMDRNGMPTDSQLARDRSALGAHRSLQCWHHECSRLAPREYRLRTRHHLDLRHHWLRRSYQPTRVPSLVSGARCASSTARLRHAQANGGLDPAAATALLAKIASAVLHTLALRPRAGDSRASLRAAADGGVRLILGTSGPRRSSPRRRRSFMLNS